MPFLKIITLALALSAAAGGACLAQDSGAPASPQRGAVRQACASDIAALCGDADRSTRRQCVMAKFDQLSDGCKAAIKAMRDRRASGDGMKPH